MKKTFIAQLEVTEKKAVKAIEAIVSNDPIILFDPEIDEEDQEEDIDNMPDFETNFGWANMIKIYRDEKGTIIIEGIEKEYGQEVECALHELAVYATCSLADHLSSLLEPATK